MASSEDEDRRRAEKARQVGLFRYSLIQDLLDANLTTRERGCLARQLTEKEHTDPVGQQVRVSRGTVDRWTRDYRSGGIAVLVPEPRKAVPRTPPEVLELAAALKRENPARTAAQIQRILRTTQGWSPTERTLQRHFVSAGLTATSGDKSVFGRFEATRGNELWTGDALHGPKIGGRKTYLFAFIDEANTRPDEATYSSREHFSLPRSPPWPTPPPGPTRTRRSPRETPHPSHPLP